MTTVKLFFCFILAISFFSCRSERKKNQNFFNMYLSSDPSLLDPRVAGNSEPQILIAALFEGLMRPNREGNPEPGLAERYEMAQDHLSCKFYLRKTVWSNGSPVTAHDFANSWREGLSPTFDSNHAFAFYCLKNAKAAKEGKISIDQIGVKALDDRILLVEFEYPAPYFIELTTNPLYSPVYLASSKEFISNGPFILKEHKVNDYFILEKNKNYWDAESVKIDGIYVVILPDPNTALMMFEAGQIDIFGNPISEIPLEAGLNMEKKGILRSAPMNRLSWFIFNTEKSPFNSKKIRQAFSYAIDRKKIVNELLQRGDTPSTSILPQNLLLQKEPYFPDGDIENARRLFHEGLQELGMTKETMPEIELTFSSKWNQKIIAQAIQDQWRVAFDIFVALHSTEKSIYAPTNANQKFQIAFSGWDSWINDPSYNLGHLKTKNRLNLSQWENAHYQELIELAENEKNPEQRLEYFHQAETLVMDEMPIAPLFSWLSKYSVSDGVEGVCFSRDGRLYLNWVSKK